MLKLDVPFTQIEMEIASTMALLKLNKVFEEKGEDYMTTVMEESLAPLQAQASTQACADFHGISIDTLVNSPNLEILQGQHHKSLFNQVVLVFKEKFELSEKEAISFIWQQSRT